MKTNGNDARKGNYYIGLDVGTESVGWAVTDNEYNVKKFKGNAMWGARLFDEANDASSRRTARTNRRRLNRRKQRLTLLEELLADELCKKDPNFFVRMRESNLWQEDRSDNSYHYVLFNDPDYTDKDYLKQFPTVYHLRSELIKNLNPPYDIRFVYLALHHILKSRGHFLFEGTEDSENGKTLDDAIEDLKNCLSDFDINFEATDKEALKEAIASDSVITDKKKKISAAYGIAEKNEDAEIDITCILELLSGATVKLSKLFNDESLKNADLQSISLKDDLDSKYDQLIEVIDDNRLEVITIAKEIYDVARLQRFLGDEQYLSDAKIRQYEKNRRDLKVLKNYVRKNLPEEYKEIFEVRSGVKNYAAYSRYKTDEKCTQEEFCSYLKSKVSAMKDSSDEDEKRIYAEIESKEFMPKLRSSENGVIPYQLQLKELNVILKNAETYLEFLKEPDENGLTVSDKIRSIFTFKIPYYIGPLNKKAQNGWVIRSNEKIYPWNFSSVVNEEQSANAFMERLIGRCTYTKEPVLPLNSLLYSEYMVLNEINPLKINGHAVSVEVKQDIFNELFVKSKKKVTKKGIYKFLLSKGYIQEGDEISGVDDVIKSNLKSWHDFRQIIEKTNDTDQVEAIIKSIVVFSDNKKMLKKWLDQNTHGLTEEEKRYIQRLNYKDWGRLSKQFLTEIYSIDENGEAMNIIEGLRNTNDNLMKLLSSEYQYSEQLDIYLKEHGYAIDSIREYLEDLYIAPAVKRSIWQTLRIVDEIVDIEKSAPKKIFIEMARDNANTVKKSRTESRKKQLMELYKSCKKDCSDLYKKLEGETDQSLRRDKLYLYYTQFGRCMYSGEPIDLEKMLKDNTTYDIDHIYPRSRIQDDSLNNRVLVKSTLNRDKTNTYPIADSIREKMNAFWLMLKDKKLISEVKYDRLIRNYPLTKEELSSFVARQLTETQQSTKALAAVLKKLYPSDIIYSKAGNVSRFRQQFDIVKNREVNDLHHAKDAYLNIVVGNVYHTKFTEKFFLNIEKENYSLNKVFDFDTPGAWDRKETIKTVKRFVAKNNPIVTFMPVVVNGAISDLQILPKGKGQLETKRGHDIQKYGGYNNVSGKYFSVIEYKDKKNKTVRAIVPVYIHNEKEFQKNKEEYFRKEFGDVTVICPRILKNSIIEIDGSKYIITRRTETRLGCKHPYQLSIDNDRMKYLNNVRKYTDRCDAVKKRLDISVHDNITINKNIELYDWFISKLESNTYRPYFESLIKDLITCRRLFIEKDEYTQCKLLLEILKAFKCDTQNVDLKALNGKGNTGIIRISRVLNAKSIYLINQSVTGLYEHKVDLLK